MDPGHCSVGLKVLCASAWQAFPLSFLAKTFRIQVLMLLRSPLGSSWVWVSTFPCSHHTLCTVASSQFAPACAFPACLLTRLGASWRLQPGAQSAQLAFVEGRNGAKHPGFLLELHSHRDPWDFPGSLFPYSQDGLFLRSPLVSQILKMFKLNNCHISNFKLLQGIGLPVDEFSQAKCR